MMMNSINKLQIILAAIKNGEKTAKCECGGSITYRTTNGRLSAAQCDKCSWKMRA